MVADALAQVVKFDGGRVYRNGAFVEAGLLTRRGVIVDAPQDSESVEVVDVRGKYLLPAFGDAHTHRFTEEDSDAKEMYLAAGFLYLQNLNGNALSRLRTVKDCNNRSSPDVRFANAGFTCTDGHPVGLYMFLANRDGTADKAATFERITNYNFYITDSVEEVAEKWPKFARSGADIVKLFLLHSERWATTDSKENSQGLRPEVARSVAQRAQAAGLRMAAHVESAADAQLALDCGVSLLAHMPGYGIRPDQDVEGFVVSDELLKRAEDAGLAMTPTLGLLYGDPKDEAGLAKILAWKVSQVKRWKDAGVLLLYGSDNYFDPVNELKALIGSGVWSNAELVKMISVDTPRWIWPGRSIGSLEVGSEAGVVVLGGDPLADARELLKVEAVYKDGVKVWERKPEGGK
jgi:imidazolonepropionase-like amidohydrolase